MYLELDHLKKHFDGREVVRDLSLTLEQGQLLCILGASGCGKTTTLNMIGGFLEPDSGSVRLDGQDITRIPPEQRPVTTVFQSYGLFPHMTVLQNVVYGLKFRGVKREQARQKGMRYLEMVGLGDYASAYIQEISGGQQQRVALARALVIEPSVLLFDEPLSNLDAKLRVTMRTEIRKIQQKVGITAIYVTHDQSEAMSISDKIIIMSKGKVEQIGTPREIYYHPNSRFVADFIGEANFLEARVRSASGEKAVIDVVGQELTVNNFAKAGPGDDAVLVIRPEGATLAEQGLLEGTVTLSTFMGSYQYYQVMVGNMEIQITDYNPVNRRIYEVGEKAYLDFDPKGVYIL